MRFDTRQFGDQPFEFLVSHSNNRVYLQDAWATTLRCYVEAEPPNRFGVEGEGEDFTSTFLVANSRKVLRSQIEDVSHKVFGYHFTFL